LYGSLARYKVLRLGEKDAEKYLSLEPAKKILKAALPHQADWIENSQPGAYYHLLDEVQKLLLAELRKIVDGRVADRDAAERAKEIMSAVSDVQHEEEKRKSEAAKPPDAVNERIKRKR
jgi:hypothetical protein